MSDGANVNEMREGLSKDLNGWGISLIIMGILHFVLSSFLWAEWGVVLIILGILCLGVKHRVMFILVGLGLMFIGIVNGLGGLGAGNTFWSIFGGLQVYWGLQEMRKFETYKGLSVPVSARCNGVEKGV